MLLILIVTLLAPLEPVQNVHMDIILMPLEFVLKLMIVVNPLV